MSGTIGVSPNMMRSGIIGEGLSASQSSFHYGSTGGWKVWQNEIINGFSVDAGDCHHTIGGDYDPSTSIYTTPCKGVYAIFALFYTYWDDASGNVFLAVNNSIFSGQADGWLMNASSGGTTDTIKHYEQIFQFAGGVGVSMRASAGTVDVHRGNSHWGGYLIEAN